MLKNLIFKNEIRISGISFNYEVVYLARESNWSMEWLTNYAIYLQF